MSEQSPPLSAEHKPVVIVSGLGRCGMALMTAALAAGGLDICGARPPFFEHAPVDIPGPFSEAARLSHTAAFLAAKSDLRLRPILTERFSGKVVKITRPSAFWIPSRSKVLWMERDERQRTASLIRHFGYRSDDAKAKQLANQPAEFLRAQGMHALRSAQAEVRVVPYEHFVEPTTCRQVVSEVAEFLCRPVDHAAMVERVAACREARCDEDLLATWYPEIESFLAKLHVAIAQGLMRTKAMSAASVAHGP